MMISFFEKLQKVRLKQLSMVVKRVSKKRLFNKLPTRIYPFVKSRCDFNGIGIDLITHSQDFAVGGRLRGERNRDMNLLGELEYFQSVIKPDSVVLDAGANVGVVSIILSKIAPTATIYSYEPEPLNYSLFNLNLVLNNIDNVSPHNFALGLECEYINMHLSNMNFGDHRSYQPLSSEVDNFQNSTVSVLKVNPSDHLRSIDPRGEDVMLDIVKIDTQGADIEILESCLPLLHPGSVVSMEFSPFHLHSFGIEMDSIMQLFSKFKLVQRILPKNRSPRVVEVEDSELFDLYELNRITFVNYYDLLLTF